MARRYREQKSTVKYKKHTAVDGIWTEWVHPLRNKYNMMCCDCNLVHHIKFKIIEHRGKPRIIFRVARNNRATAAMRRASRG